MRFNYPEQLPITAHKEEIVKAIQENQVAIVVGETGSGKSTQIPKMILEALARNEKTDPEFTLFKIACTQPRRLAATSIASWIAHEMGVELGQQVGYKIRFDDETMKGTMITICTDGILLQEMKGDGLLSTYDAILVDEAHERNLNIDFLLGLLKDIQKKRVAAGMKVLKILITSATVDSEKFANFFAELNGAKPIPVVNVSGRLYPVTVQYNPVQRSEDIYQKIAEIIRGIVRRREQGDVLIFMPGEGEIFSTIREIDMLGMNNIVCLPLYSRLTMDEQEQIYDDYGTKLKIVVATNIAETSLTVPGVKYVLDPGMARMTGFDFRTGIGSLEIREISQSSAIQRAGRAGRVQAGTAIRLFEEENFDAREKYTKPEIQRSDLSSVVLHMILIGIKDVQHFNFIDAPQPQAFRNAIENLHELGALDGNNNLTALGLKMAHLPLEPRISAMLLAAERYDCVRETAIIASSLSVKDPFLRPNGEEEEADRAKRYFQRLATGRTGRYKVVTMRRGRKVIRRKVYEESSQQILASDLMVFLIVWNKLQDLSLTDQREQYCQANYLNFKIFQEIEQIYFQLLDTLKTFGGAEFAKYLQEDFKEEEAIKKGLVPEGVAVLGNLKMKIDHPENILKAISTGFIQNLCEEEGKQIYRSRNTEGIFIHPGSILFNISPRWFVSAEIIETTRLYARNNTMVDPTWFEEIAPQLCQRKKGNIFLDAMSGQVVREEEVFFRGHRIVKARLVKVAEQDRGLAQEYFIREGLIKKGVLKGYQASLRYLFVLQNEKMIEQLRIYAAKLKNAKLNIDDVKLLNWYLEKAKRAGFVLTSRDDLDELMARKGPSYFTLKQEDFLSPKEQEHLDKKFPAKLFINGEEREIRYFFNDYRYPAGPVISFSVQDLVNLDQEKLLNALQNIGDNFKPHLVVSNGEPFSAVVAEGDNLDDLKKEVDRWYLRKFWKKTRHDQEVKGIRFEEIYAYLERVLERVEIGHSLFYGEGANAVTYAFTGLRIEGRKITLALMDDLAVAAKMTLHTLKALFANQVKNNLYFKESDILRLEKLYSANFEGVEIKEVLLARLWKKLDFEGEFADVLKMKKVTEVKAFLERSKVQLENYKQGIVKEMEQELKQIVELAKSNKPEDLELLLVLKKKLEV